MLDANVKSFIIGFQCEFVSKSHTMEVDVCMQPCMLGFVMFFGAYVFAEKTLMLIQDFSRGQCELNHGIRTSLSRPFQPSPHHFNAILVFMVSLAALAIQLGFLELDVPDVNTNIAFRVALML